jgi:serine/threonine protein kinase
MKKKKLSEKDIMRYFTMILIGLQYLHSNNIIHRDLKPENILINTFPDGSDILIIGDFGISKKGIENIRKTNTLNGLGTVYYMAPETIYKNLSSSKVDMWALGIILYQLFENVLPFVDESYYSTCKLIIDKDPAPLSSTVPPFIK